MNRNRRMPLADRKSPSVRRGHPLECDAVMRAEFTGSLWRAASRQICRACADDAANRANPARDQTAVRQLADSDREVDMFFQDVGDAVGQRGPNVDVRKSLEELDRDRKNVQAAEDDWRGDDQIAFGSAVFARRGALGLPQVFQDALTGLYVGLPCFGERDVPTRPAEESGLEGNLELRNPTADGR